MNINIKSVETRYVTEMPAMMKLINPDYLDEFHPYYECRIKSSKGLHYGKGESEYAAEQAALNSLKGSLAAEMYSALEQYNARHGAGNLDIA